MSAGQWLHGECVSIGCISEAQLALEWDGGLTRVALQRLTALFQGM